MSAQPMAQDAHSHQLRGPLVMPFANVTHLSFAEKLETTRLAGFGGLTLRPYDALLIRESGLTLDAARKMAADMGIEVVRLDPLSAWTAMVSSDDTNLDIAPVQFFQICRELGCSHASLNATFPADHLSTDRVVEDFARTCSLAADFGVTCDLENLPMWGVRTLNDAWDIVKRADCFNGGLVFDILHFVRGGSRLSDLEAIPGERIHTVQLNDGPLRLPSGVSLLENCFQRLWPGDGEFPITDVLQILARIGGLSELNPEVFSPSNKDFGPSEIASRSARSMRNALALADIRI